MPLTSDFLAATSRSRALWWVEIEGLRRRYGTGVPSWSPADTGTNRPILPWLAAIPEIGPQTAEVLNGTTKAPSIGVEVLDVDDEFTDLVSVHNRSSANRTTLTSSLSSVGTSLTVEDSGVFALPCDLYLDRETVRATAAPDGTHLTVTRGMYGSAAVAHSIENTDGSPRTVEVIDRPQFIHTRELKLCLSWAGLLEDDCITVRAFVDGIEEGSGVWSVSASGGLARLSARIGEKQISGKLRFALGGKPGDVELPDYWHAEYDYHNPNIKPSEFMPFFHDHFVLETGQGDPFPKDGLVKIDDELVFYEDRAALDTDKFLLNADIYELGILDYCYTGRGMFASFIFPEKPGIHIADVWKRSNPLVAWHQVGAEVKLCLWHENFLAGTDPASVFLQILLSGNGTGGTYDTLPDGWGLGLPEALVDIEGIEDLKSSVASIDLKFAITKPVEAAKWLQENVLRPSMLFPVELLDGRISLSRLWTKQEAECRGATVALDHSRLLDVPKFSMGAPPVGDLKIRMNYDPGGEDFWGDVRVQFGESAERYRGVSQSVELEVQSIYSTFVTAGSVAYETNLGNLPAALAALVGSVFDRFALQPTPSIEVQVPWDLWPLVGVGSVVTFTCTATPNVKTGARGVLAEFCQVISCKPNPRKSCLVLKLQMIGVHDANFRRIAPSAKVRSYTGDVGSPARTKVEIYRHEFTNPDGTRNDLDEFAVGDKVRFYSAQCEPMHATLEAALEIDEIDTSGATYDIVWLVETELDYPPSDGDFLEVADYDQAEARQQGAFAFQADASALLGTGNDPGHVRT